MIDHISSPKDLKNLDVTCLPNIAEEIRNLIIEVISSKGGHFASNLGSVELTIALHYAFDTPSDRLIWDVGHQAYAHKILTGRKHLFHTIRQQEGLSGFPVREESEYDHFGTGHASTSISAALGISEAMTHSGSSHFAIAIIGDGSMTGGLAFEALNNAGHIPAKNLVVVLNDNNMSIDPNVGALQKYLNQRINSSGYNLFRKELRLLVDSLDSHGLNLMPLVTRLRRSVKHLFTPQMLYECLGFRYFGPIDGHDIEALVKSFSFIKNEEPNGPYLVHALTTKGKGYKPAEKSPFIYHGVSPFKVEQGISSNGGSKLHFQDVFADTLVKLAKEDPRIIAITAAMPSGTGLNLFQQKFPKRCYDVGIAEQHAVLFAAGLATEGFRPVVAIYSTFLQRSFDQIIHDVSLQNLPVFFVVDRAGLVGADGATHQGQFDLSYLRMVPNFVIMAPKDENELQHMIKTGLEHLSGPIAVRFPRGKVTGVSLDSTFRAIPIGKAELLNSDSEKPDVLFIGIGQGVQLSLKSQLLLQQGGFRTSVINSRFIKPLDTKLLCHWIQASHLVVTVEENAAAGGFGSAVLEMMNEHRLKRDTLLFGIPDQFIKHASPDAQRIAVGLDSESIALKILERLRSKKASRKIRKPSTIPLAYESGIIPLQ